MEELQLRIYSAAVPTPRHAVSSAAPTLLYLPGLHGDWTLIGSFRRAIKDRVRFAEITYPRTLTWTLDDYAAAVETALLDKGINDVWLLGESFSSQVVWPLLARGKLRIKGVILAGGFVRHPVIWGVRAAEFLLGKLSLGIIAKILFGYARFARARFRNSPEIRANIQEFIDRRTRLDQQAAQHRLHLLANNDPCAIARNTRYRCMRSLVCLTPSSPGSQSDAGYGKTVRRLRNTG